MTRCTPRPRAPAASPGCRRPGRAVRPVDGADGRYRTRFTDPVADDLGTPRALAIAHEVSADTSLTDAQRRALLLDLTAYLASRSSDPRRQRRRSPRGPTSCWSVAPPPGPPATSPPRTRFAISFSSRCRGTRYARRPGDDGPLQDVERASAPGADAHSAVAGWRDSEGWARLALRLVGDRSGGCRHAIRLNRDRDPAVADREDDGVRAIRCRELVRDRPKVVADRLLADPQDLPDLAVRATASDLGQHLELAHGQRTRWRTLPGLSAIPTRLILGTGTRQRQLQTWRRAMGSRHRVRLRGPAR